MARQQHECRKHFSKTTKNGREANECRYCAKVLLGNATTLSLHLSTCLKFKSRSDPEAEGNSPDAASESTDSGAASQTSVSSTSTLGKSSIVSSQSSQRLIYQPLITDYMDMPIDRKRKQQIDTSLTSLLVKCNIPFQAIEHPAFQRFCSALNSKYQLPSRRVVSNRLLNVAYDENQEKVKLVMETCNYLSIVVDGWKDVTQQQVINVVACIRRPILLSSNTVEEDRITGDVYKKIIWDTITKYELEGKVVQIISDKGSNVMNARDSLMNEKDGIWSSTCVSHQLNNVIKEFLSIPSIHQQINLLIRILTKIKYNSPLRASCKRVAAALGVTFNQVVLPAPTRWEYYERVLGDVLDKQQVIREQLILKTFHKYMTISEEEEEIVQLLTDPESWIRMAKVTQYFRCIGNNESHSLSACRYTDTCSVSLVS